MGMTIAEKIIALAAGVPQVKAGDIHTVTLDRMMSNDGTTHLTVDMYHNRRRLPRRRCGTLPGTTALISGRAQACAIRS